MKNSNHTVREEVEVIEKKKKILIKYSEVSRSKHHELRSYLCKPSNISD